MKQILQNLKSGVTELSETPCPSTGAGHLLICTTYSLISAGTERMLVEFGKAGFLDKAKQQPDKVRLVLDKIKTDGLLPTIDAVQAKLDQPLVMGYCNVGRVIKAESGSGFVSGDRVLSTGHHAEVVSVPRNLCARIPENVSDEEATFTVIGAIGLQGIRLASPTLGESFAVTGLGLVGLMTVQLLLAQGCRVLGIDFDSQKCELARRLGASVVDLSKGEDPVSVAMDFSRGRGMDGVLVCASSKSNDPMHQAANMCRKRGRIVLVGVVGLGLSRADFFEKELSFQVSCSYGPGRYDTLYEDEGQDYPVGYVRWTEQRNFEAVLDMMASGRLDVKPLISHRFPLDKASDAYRVLVEDRASLGILLQYPSVEKRQENSLNEERTIRLQANTLQHSSLDDVVVGFIGAGNYATRILIPAFKGTNAVLHTVASSTGVSGSHAGRKYGFLESTTDTSQLLASLDVNTVVISTRHNNHASLTCDALKNGKNVFVEKPLCLTLDQLYEIKETYSACCRHNSTVPVLMVGFNRRFAPQVQKIKSLLASVNGPKSFVVTVNAGAIPSDHWTQDPEVGGGRIIGEACHFVDLLRFLSGSAITSHSCVAMDSPINDTVSLQLDFADGSIGTVHYFANGNNAFPKERLEVFVAGRVLQLDNFRKLRGYGWPGFTKMNLWRQDKGQFACVMAFVYALRQGSASPIPFDDLIEVSRVAIEVAQS